MSRACLLFLLLEGCAAAVPQRFYALNLPSVPEARTGSAHPSFEISIAPVTLPQIVDRPQLVTRIAPNRVQLLENDRWAEPLKNQIGRALAAHLALRIPEARVLPYRSSSGSAAQWRLTIDLQRLEATPGASVLLEAAWSAQRTGSNAHFGRALIQEPVSSGIEALVAAHDRVFGRLAKEIADTLEAVRTASP